MNQNELSEFVAYSVLNNAKFNLYFSPTNKYLLNTNCIPSTELYAKTTKINSCKVLALQSENDKLNWQLRHHVLVLRVIIIILDNISMVTRNQECSWNFSCVNLLFLRSFCTVLI